MTKNYTEIDEMIYNMDEEVELKKESHRDRMKRLRRRNRAIIMRRRVIATVVCMVIALSVALASKTILSDAKSGAQDNIYKYYTSICVEYGDTLTSIANAYKSSDCTSSEYIYEVKLINHLDSDAIKAGDHLIVPYFSNELK